MFFVACWSCFLSSKRPGVQMIISAPSARACENKISNHLLHDLTAQPSVFHGFLYTISACIQFIKWVKGKHCWIITVVAGSVDIGFDDYSWGARKINKKELGSTLSAVAKHLRRHKQPPHGQLSWLSSRGQKCRLLRRCFKRHKPARHWNVCKPGNLTQLEHKMFQYLSILW